MNAEPESTEVRRLLGGGLGLFLIVFGVGIGFWVVKAANTAFFHPENMPLLEMVLADDSGSIGIGGGNSGGEAQVSFSTSVLPIVVVGFLLLALVSIAGAALTGGVKLLGGALGLLPASPPKEKQGE